MTASFPADFLWGAGTAGHQIEGGNVNADTWALEWEPNSIFSEPSGDACDSYHRYPEDIGLLSDSGLNTYRFSAEWSRIEPEEGFFSRAALDHYRRVLAACWEREVTPVLTCQHFTVPRWFAARGGWSAPGAAELFGRYVERLARHLGDLAPWVCTINEANILAVLAAGASPASSDSAGASDGEPEKGLRSGFPFPDVAVMGSAHRAAVRSFRSVQPDVKIGWTLALPDYRPVAGGEGRLDVLRRAVQLDWLEVSADDDFVGVQTYYRRWVGAEGVLPVPVDAPVSLLGWEISPDALEHTVRLAAEHSGVPVLVTENGIPTRNDQDRIESMTAALEGLERALGDGIEVLGYLHWSLLDNFEWLSGYGPTFGLVEVDRDTFERRAKPSLGWLGNRARAATTGHLVPGPTPGRPTPRGSRS